MLRPEQLWRLSSRLHHSGHLRAARAVKLLNSAIYHNSLDPAAIVADDLWFGHHGFGTVIHGNVTIGPNVRIWHGVTIAVRASSTMPARVVIEEDVMIGANSVVVTPYERGLVIGRGARIGAGTVVSQDVPRGATVVSQPPRILQAGEDD